jgi:predicted PurR-regulated permease PerM
MEQNSNTGFIGQAVEAAIKIAVIFFLASWCYQILTPFIAPLIWALIIAIACKPLSDYLEQRCNLSRRIAALIVTLGLLTLLISPTVLLSSSTLTSLKQVSANIESGEFTIDPPQEEIKQWPLIGAEVYGLWHEAATSAEDTIKEYQPEIKAAVAYTLKQIASFGGSILLFILAIVISGFILLRADSAEGFMRRLGQRLAGAKGEEFVSVASVTIRNVTRGILGVAIIQSLLAALGLYLMNIPVAGLLALGVLAFAIVQLPTSIILIPVSIYTFTITDTTIAALFLIWNLVVGLLDNFLKPLLMGKGASVPTLVIFLGAIGGFISMGLIGLFVGAVIVVLGYEMFLIWLGDRTDSADEKTPFNQTPPD